MLPNISVLAAIILVIILLGYYYFFVSKSSFAVLFDDESTRVSKCFEYLLYDGSNYYLFDSRLPIDGVSNPKKFSTAISATKYLNGLGCGPLPVLDLRANNMPFDSSGNLLDPQVSYEWQCNRKNAQFIDHLGKCLSYAKTEDDFKKYLDITNQQSQMVNFDLESCMLRDIQEQNAELAPRDSTDLNDYIKRSTVNVLALT